ncbi:unnamed protein product [Angiostrongylus costaricensis]|uniref:DUF5641 domain-containing protein n=1 Tax=Angiostrongylus costaricensis TaxID=334426 RepID=A0A0R3Q264_ANGCS|nr:unnamed protein product [Angiostrongylus costaricensis]
MTSFLILLKLTEHYWNVWSREYLKGLRETHKLNINNKRGTRTNPTIGTVVLIQDPALPRNAWRMARIIDLKQTETGAIREAQLKLPSGRIIRRPINLLIPLELEDSPAEKRSGTNDETESPNSNPHSAAGIPDQRYNLRPRSRDNNVLTIGQRCCSPQVEEDHDPKKHSEENGQGERESLCHHYDLQSEKFTQRTTSATALPTPMEVGDYREFLNQIENSLSV